MFLILFSISLCFSWVSAVTDSLTVIYTAVSGIDDFPEVTNVAIVKGVQVNYHDTHIRRMIPRIMMEYFDKEYWEHLTFVVNTRSDMAIENLNTVMKMTNQTTGIHVFQWILIGEVTEDGSIRRSMRVGFDGKDYISFGARHNEMGRIQSHRSEDQREMGFRSILEQVLENSSRRKHYQRFAGVFKCWKGIFWTESSA
ncbi:class I histocompatibility antigen, F10 alpha chain-like [Scyliorhinus canicula]|uniref:class I histocompatibility antigen, F10 alpha chain-like n=1 Tax=Scyliorhinus canicula TaxID=7830 RepID=UPI0018F73BFF|nr:class I histocompatibility antigen, F10 alpha chain-like [Scyliorhinus canicula]